MVFHVFGVTKILSQQTTEYETTYQFRHGIYIRCIVSCCLDVVGLNTPKYICQSNINNIMVFLPLLEAIIINIALGGGDQTLQSNINNNWSLPLLEAIIINIIINIAIIIINITLGGGIPNA